MKFIFVGILFISLNVFAETYNMLDANVRQFQSRVEEKRNHLKELGEKKAELRDQAAIRAILDEMIVEAREMKENFVKFQKEKKKLMYEHPQKGDLTERQYKRFELETIEEMSTLSNIDLRLKGILTQVEKTYEKSPEQMAIEKQKKAKMDEELGRKPTKPTHATSIKVEPTPSPARPTLSY